MSESLQNKVERILAKAKKAQNGICPQCEGTDWIKVGLPGMWDWECETCGYMQPNSPYAKQQRGDEKPSV